MLAKITERGSEVAAVRAVVVLDHVCWNVHSLLDQPQLEIMAIFYLAAALPVVTEVSVEWLEEADMVIIPASVPPVQYFEAQPGSKVCQCFSSTPDRQVGRLSSYDHVNTVHAPEL